MLNTLLAATDKTREIGLSEAALYAVLGFAIVFVGIAFLILVVWLVGKVMSAGGKANKKAVQTEKSEMAPVTAPTPEQEELSGETVAVIMASLMAYYERTNPKCEFTVKRIKRI